MPLSPRLLARLEPLSHPLVTVTTLALSLLLTLGAWKLARDSVHDEARHQFEFSVTRATEAIQDRMLDYEQVLRGGVGLFAASLDVNREEWKTYVQALKLETHYPGIYTMGYVTHVPGPDKARHVNRLRTEGFGDYRVYPEGERSEYGVVIYVEPYAARHVRALGYDMLSDATRRRAMEQARDTGRAAISNRVTLVQDDDGTRAEPGFLMYLPVYRNGTETESPAQRRQALTGYVFGQFRVGDFVRGVLGRQADLRLQIFDGETTDPAHLIYDGFPASAESDHARQPAFQTTVSVSLQDHRWTLRAISLPAFEARMDSVRPLLAFGGGTVISLMLTLLIWLVSTLLRRATRLASRMTTELRESRERVSLALDGSNLAMFDWHIPGGKVHLSERWRMMLGGDLRPTDTTIAELEKMVHPDDRRVLQEKLRPVLKGRAVFYAAEHRVRTLDGGWRWILSRAKVVERDRDGKAVRVTGTNSDITARKEAESRRSEFIATVSHELRTPLTAVVGSLALLREGSAGTLPQEARPFMDMAYQNTERLVALVNDLLDLEKVESGHMQFDIERVALAGFLDHVASINNPYATQFDVRLELRAPAPDIAVRADRARLLQVLTNLLSNAVKHAPAQSGVVLTAQPHDGVVRISVVDRGPGVPIEFRDRIFGKFEQAGGSGTQGHGGSGLGLAISKALVDGMNGTIGFTSLPGQGTTFFVDLPPA